MKRLVCFAAALLLSLAAFVFAAGADPVPLDVELGCEKGEHATVTLPEFPAGLTPCEVTNPHHALFSVVLFGNQLTVTSQGVPAGTEVKSFTVSSGSGEDAYVQTVRVHFPPAPETGLPGWAIALIAVAGVAAFVAVGVVVCSRPAQPRKKAKKK